MRPVAVYITKALRAPFLADLIQTHLAAPSNPKTAPPYAHVRSLFLPGLSLRVLEIVDPTLIVEVGREKGARSFLIIVMKRRERKVWSGREIRGCGLDKI